MLAIKLEAVSQIGLDPKFQTNFKCISKRIDILICNKLWKLFRCKAQFLPIESAVIISFNFT